MVVLKVKSSGLKWFITLLRCQISEMTCVFAINLAKRGEKLLN